jgi:hypothetical protein
MSGTDADRRQLAEGGLREAHSRLSARLSGQDSGDPVISLGEFLTWLYALRDHHRGKRKLTPQTKARSASPDEQTFYALVFARNQIQHDLERTGELVERLIPAGPTQAVRGQSRLAGMMPLSEYRWKTRANLAPTIRNPELKPLYDAHVAGKPILEPIDVAMTFLVGLP